MGHRKKTANGSDFRELETGNQVSYKEISMNFIMGMGIGWYHWLIKFDFVVPIIEFSEILPRFRYGKLIPDKLGKS
jgi:hypothetical protein